MTSWNRAAIQAALAIVLVSPALGQDDCPVAFNIDEIVTAIAAAPDCKAADKIARSCAFGASGDTQTAGAVQEKCEKDFLPGLNAAQAKAYRSKIKACATKYAKRSGTMYISMAAFCASDVAVAFSARAKR